jgi:hypothetical protein
VSLPILEHHREALEKIGDGLLVKELDDWYNVKPSDVLAGGGRWV